MTTMTRSDDDEGWQYVYEALQNVRCLQLLLFHRALSPNRDCVNFTAVFVVRHGSLRCDWNSSSTGTAHSLVVPLPACLIDLSLPVRCWTRQDHVEIRLGLLSLDPALHALQLSLEDDTSDSNAVPKDEIKPFSVDFGFNAWELLFGLPIDAQALESGGEVQFFCRSCSCQLTNAPFRRIIEVPSLDWREVSEHFYGNCCCASFGAQAELLAARFQQLLTSSTGTCLVASTTCIVHKVDVKGDRDGPGSEHHSSKLEVKLESACKLDGHQNSGDGETTAEEIHKGHDSEDKFSPEGLESKTLQDTVEEPCCSSSCSSGGSACTEFSSVKEGKDASPESLGNGFLTGSQSEVLDWEPFFCRNCSSLVGARRGDNSKNGLQFFKCQISTQRSVSSSSNIFREHTLERLFTHELAKTTESNSSYRYVVRSFQTGVALLQLVLLNQNALVSSGTCPLKTSSIGGDTATESTGLTFLDNVSGCQAKHSQLYQTQPGSVSLKPVAKFMFCDCRLLGLEELRLLDKWAQIQKADDIFVLDEVAATLVDLLESHQLAYPPSCQLFQQFGLSFLTK